MSDMTKLRPLLDRVVIKRAEEKEQIVGGLYIPDTAKEKPQQGEVVAVGDGRILENGTRVPLDLKVGDQVLFGKYSGTEVKIDDEEYLIVRENDIFGIVDATLKAARPASAQKRL
jgi:chaperonin GroES